MLGRVLRVAGWIVFSVLLVLLVPSSAWSGTGEPVPSDSASVSPQESGSPSDGPTSDSPTPLDDPSAESGTPAAESSPEEPSQPSESEATLAEGSCSAESPCVVALGTETEGWLLLASGLNVALLGALLVTTWANGGD